MAVHQAPLRQHMFPWGLELLGAALIGAALLFGTLLILEWPPAGAGQENGAEDGTRTRDPHLGKVMLYQLSHFRRRCDRKGKYTAAVAAVRPNVRPRRTCETRRRAS